MPIRTNRGRAAVYRKVWGWPLRSPRHLVVAIVIFAVLATAIGVGLANARSGDRQSKQGPPPMAGPSFTVTDPPPVNLSTLPNRIETPSLQPTAAKPNPEGLATATNWTKAWANHPKGMTQQQWLAGLKPLTTDEYLPTMATVDLTNIPAKKVTGQAKATKSFTSSMQVTVPTDGGAISVTVIDTPDGWRVSGYTKA